MDMSLVKEVPAKFWKSSGFELRIRTPDSARIHLGRGLRSLSALVSSSMCQCCLINYLIIIYWLIN